MPRHPGTRRSGSCCPRPGWRGVQLKQGLYTLKLGSEGNPTVKAQIFRNGKPVVESSVTVRPRTNEQSNTIMQDADGTLREIRLKKQVIVFPSTE